MTPANEQRKSMATSDYHMMLSVFVSISMVIALFMGIQAFDPIIVSSVFLAAFLTVSYDRCKKGRPNRAIHAKMFCTMHEMTRFITFLMLVLYTSWAGIYVYFSL